ncbi:putative bifunctional diguanylate cyclase/phosphodiesterase [Arthrobacter caoxuetaonis]|uniref:EAL domain-containing protein n=1 Tax=Arthrobacter caoxuetaonis TaxID=2886935 RepID=A0A9X1SC25_9MICC|nr:EAL domain-containing protein [Arthrobacter caoxuetaonis]MCC3297206.1 EAL domain-containing protein [Arthrobacter caoxuetaonis]USQ58237.1 EAL domain-containing protein [Arthrobacter caoxuetaonis]
MTEGQPADTRLQQVVDGIVRIAAGDLSTRIRTSPNRDDVDAVITGINLLAEELNSVYQEFEERVESRTIELQAAHRQMQRMAMSDALTGMANRTALMHGIEAALLSSEDGAKRPSVLMIDLDAFKDINDSFGHQTGDQVLVEVARRIRWAVRRGDTVARLGGDEFAVLLPETSLTAAMGVAARVQEALTECIRVDELDVWPRASIGAHAGQAGESAEDIMVRADTAMYAAKEAGRGQNKAFEPVMLYSRQLRRDMAAELRQGVGRDELFLDYQPVVELASGRMIGVEALIRWQHPQRGLVMPDDFIPIAEETGIILDLGRWVLRAALEQVARWEGELALEPDFKVRVNLSAMELQRLDLVDHVRQALTETGISPGRLIIEITESAFVSGGDVEMYSLRSLSALGVGIEIDDFGTGYSSISYLRRLPVHTVKVDRSLIRDISADPGQRHFVDAVHGLIQAAGMEAVFEGIETLDQAADLLVLGCRSGQGYYFSRPLAARQVADILETGAVLPLVQAPANSTGAG